MDIVILTNEYPPNVYGGAGVHVEYLTRELARLDGARHAVQVFSFGDQSIQEGNLTVRGIQPDCDIPCRDPRRSKLMDPLVRDLAMAAAIEKADVVHCHTWYTHFAGCLVQQLTDAVLVLTTHSLEPHRPWKAEQLGTAYRASPGWKRPHTKTPTALSRSRRRCARMFTTCTASPQIAFASSPTASIWINTIRRRIAPCWPNTRSMRTSLSSFRRPHHPAKGDYPSRKLPEISSAGRRRSSYTPAPDTEEIGREMAERVEQARREPPIRLSGSRKWSPKAT